MSKDFVHVHLHTEFSYLDGLSKIWDVAAKKPGDLVNRIKELGQKYCAITDHGSTSGWTRFDKAMKKLELVPIFGVEGYFCDDNKVKGLSEEQRLKAGRGLVGKDKRAATRELERKLGLDKRAHFTCWAMNEDGIIEILKTQSIAATDGFYYKPRWDFGLIKQMKNCMFGSACAGGILNYYLNKKGKTDEIHNFIDSAIDAATVEAERWKSELGDRFYIELQPIDWEVQRTYNQFCFIIAKRLGIKCYLANDSHYVNPEDWEVHDTLLAIQSSFGTPNPNALNDPNRLRYAMHDLYVKSRKEMFSSFFKHNKDYPKEFVSEMLDNTVEIAERCHHSIIKKKMIMPKMKIPNGLTQEDYFKALIKVGWKKKIVPYVKPDSINEYKSRLSYEIKEIIRQGFTPYFILVNRMMRWVDKMGIARGPARGSSAGSLVAYLLDITMIDPIPHKLLFSRFIDPNRTDFPDIDMDFEDRRRREVVQYLIDTYGKDNVAILGNNITFKPKLVLKDVSRLYHVPPSEVQHLCDLVVIRSGADSRLSFCLEDTFNQHEFAREFKEKYPKVAEFSKRMEGLTCRVGVHAAGVVIADGDMNRYSAYRLDKRQKDFRVATIDKHDAEDIGLLKLDVLGLNTMAILQETRKLVEKRHNKVISFEDLCIDVTYSGGDKNVYKEFAEGNVTGIFQFNTPGLERLAVQTKIDKFSEISDCTALHRPGPIHSGAMAKYPGIKHGVIKKFSSLHKIVEEETGATYGLVLYQEQVMQIVRRLGEFNWAQTNEIRKVMSKSGGAEYFMIHYWPTFKEGCAKHGVEEKTALRIFKRIVSFGSWAFNKCISGDALILNAGPNKYADKYVTIKDLYENDGYAPNKLGGKSSKYLRMRSLALCRDGRLRPLRIRQIFYQGKKELLKIVTENNNIKITRNHRLVSIKNGRLCYIYGHQIKNGTYLAIDGGYEKTQYKRSGEGNGWSRFYKNHKTLDTHKPYKDLRSREITEFRNKMKNEKCQRCGKEYNDNFEVHHVTRNPPSIMKWLCNSCHKIEDYQLKNRVIRYGKGHSITFEKVINIENCGIEDCYDIEMMEENGFTPTFIANGFVSHNSHAVSYAFVSYFCMWFKVHYPIEFCVSYLNYVNDIDGIKVKHMIDEVKRLKIKLKEPNINYSGIGFTIHGEEILAGLDKIKHVGLKAVQTIIDNRPYTGMLNFLRKIDKRACNIRAIRNLIIVGAFDEFNYDKKTLLDNIQQVQGYVKKGSEKSLQQAKELLKICRVKVDGYTEQKTAEMKRSVTPVYIGKHITRYYDDIVAKFGSHIKITKLKDIEMDISKQGDTQITMGKKPDLVRLDVWIMGLFGKPDLKRLSQEVKELIDKGEEQRYALANLEDDTDYIVLSFREGVYEKYEQKLFDFKDKVVLVHGVVNKGWKKCYVDELFVFDELREYLKNGRKPFNFRWDYLFKHTLHTYFDRYGGIQAIKKKYHCSDLVRLKTLPMWTSIYSLGVITSITGNTIRKPESELFGKKWYWVTFEDETFVGSFMIWPNDFRYAEMKRDLFDVYEKGEPTILYIQRDSKFNPQDLESDNVKRVSMSLDKRTEWKKIIHRKFRLKTS